jgi:hypothetical protein
MKCANNFVGLQEDYFVPLVDNDFGMYGEFFRSLFVHVFRFSKFS